MTKELYVSSTPHQTKIALVEDDQLAEVYFEHENEYTLAGSIYKGRVTRVLPGMQSAFVDIGLERDAFLYVSDFYEVEDEEGTVEPVPVVRPYEVRPEARAAVPAEFRGEARREAGAEAEPSGEGEESAPGGESGEESEGGRRWRGRRRGRRNRGRGFPESKFAHSPDASKEGAEAAPVVLPCESLSKFQRSGDEPDDEEGAPEAAETEPAADSTADTRPATRHEQAPSSGPAPVILPGESFAKFNRRNEMPRAAEAPTPTRTEPRRERAPQPYRPFEPIILPGESISKYERLRGQRAEAGVEVHSAEAPGEAGSEPGRVVAEPAEGNAEPAEGAEERAPSAVFTSNWSREEQAEPAVPETIAHADEPVTREPEREWQPHVEALAAAETAATEPEAGDIPHGDELGSIVYGRAEADAPAEGPGGWESENYTRHRDEMREPSVPAPSYHDAPVGSFEEQEIEDEETDLPHPAESLDEGEEFVELEEETFEAGGPTSELADAVQEVAKEREILGGYGTENENGDGEEGEGEVEEIEQYSPENGEAAEESELSRSELRGPSGTAGFQQRAVARPEFDRHQRGRRGGRRFRARRENQRQPVLISDILKEGQEVLIQIAKEPIGKKGARITSHIALPGRFLVYMPTVNHVGVSRKISSEEERQRLKRIVSSERENGHGGFIVRTAAATVSEQDLRAYIRFLKSLWNEIRTRADNSKAPALIYHDLNLVERTLRDLVTSDFSAIWVDTEAEYERVLRFVNRFQPSLVKRVKLYTKETPLFEQFGIEEEINKALKPKVWLKSGGYIVINQTEALVAIDINTGKYVGKTLRLEDTIFKTNVDACREIVRQVRLRDLGGIIVIDFIDMDERRNRQRVMQALEEELKNDRAPSKVLQFNDFGLVAITRKRVKQSLERTLGATCSYCIGSGFIKSPQTVCNEIYTELRKMVRHLEKDTLMLRVNPEVAKELKANNGRWLNDMEELTGRTIIVKPDATLHQEQFDV